MPKEYIHSQDYGREAILFTDGAGGEKIPHTEVLDNDAVKVSWSKEAGHVQVSVVDMKDDPDGFEADHISLDRAGLNRLIRFLRRARDDAFGKDE